MPARPSEPPAFVLDLCSVFREQVRRALEFDLDATPTSLAIVDHYLATARHEDREPILSLLAVGAGAYFGELVRTEIGGTWLCDGKDAWRMRMLLEPQFIHFSPTCLAFEAIVGETPDENDPRLPTDTVFGSAFVLPPGRIAGTRVPSDDDDAPVDDAGWLADRLAELPDVPPDQFYSLTARFETLSLMLELLAERHAARGDTPRRYGLADYVDALA